MQIQGSDSDSSSDDDDLVAFKGGGGGGGAAAAVAPASPSGGGGGGKRARSPEEDGGGGGAADNGNNAVGEDGEGGGGALPQKRLRAMSAQAIEIAENAAIIQGREKDRVEARREEDARKRVKSRDVKRFSSADYFKKAGVTAENRHARTEEEAKLNEELKQGGFKEQKKRLEEELAGDDGTRVCMRICACVRACVIACACVSM